jgi:PKD repeat protein
MKTRLLMIMVAIMMIAFSCEPKEEDPIVPAPTASFSASKTAIAVGENVNFTSSVTNATKISWEFAGGNPITSSEANPIVTYATAGKYSVTLTATGSDGQIATVTKDTLIKVAAPVVLLPVAAFTADKTAIGMEDTVKFTNQSQNGPFISYSWTFDGGFPATSTEANPKVYYSNAGKFKVTLIVVSANGSNTVTKTDYITVTDNRIKISGLIKNIGNTITLTGIDIGDANASSWVGLGSTTVFGSNNSYEVLVPRKYLGKTIKLFGDIHWINSALSSSKGQGITGPTVTLQETNTVDWNVVW